MMRGPFGPPSFLSSFFHVRLADVNGIIRYNVKIDRWPQPLGSPGPPSILYPIVPPVLGSFQPLTDDRYDALGAGM